MLRSLELKDLSCGGCSVTIRTGLANAGFTEVKINILRKPHTVTAEIVDDEHLELMKKVLRDHGYPLLDDPDVPVQTDFDFA